MPQARAAPFRLRTVSQRARHEVATTHEEATRVSNWHDSRDYDCAARKQVTTSQARRGGRIRIWTYGRYRQILRIPSDWPTRANWRRAVSQPTRHLVVSYSPECTRRASDHRALHP